MHTRALCGNGGQASVETVALLPVVVAVGLAGWQLAVAGHAAWLCANAARVAARAEAVGEDGRAAARSALPDSLERGLRVDRDGELLRVRVRVPWVIGHGQTPLSLAASAGEVSR
ncbi:MAG TPA: TadE/TadG family type IV pilus assembly protein [Thermoleophilaceae bacterium]